MKLIKVLDRTNVKPGGVIEIAEGYSSHGYFTGQRFIVDNTDLVEEEIFCDFELDGKIYKSHEEVFVTRYKTTCGQIFWPEETYQNKTVTFIKVV